MTAAVPSARQAELLELAYQYAVSRGRADLSLRPLAAAIGSSPRVLLYLFGSKDGLVRAMLARARADELAFLGETVPTPARPGGAEPAAGQPRGAALAKTAETALADAERPAGTGPGIAAAADRIWSWLADEGRRGLLTLWVDGYARSLAEPGGPWAGFAAATVSDWLAVLATAQPAGRRDSPEGLAERTGVLAVLRGALLDVLATGDTARVTEAVRRQLALLPAHGA